MITLITTILISLPAFSKSPSYIEDAKLEKRHETKKSKKTKKPAMRQLASEVKPRHGYIEDVEWEKDVSKGVPEL